MMPLGHLLLSMHVLGKNGDLVELKAYREAVCDEIYLEAMSTTSYSAILHDWVRVFIYFRIVAS